MVTFVGIALASSLGLLVYIALPFTVTRAPVETRKTIGEFYLKITARCLKQFNFVRRVLSGYDVLPISVDDEQKHLKTTLTKSNIPGKTGNEYRFNDPDNRILRLYNKPVALSYEQVPAAVDAELSEIGHWAQEKHDNEGFNHNVGNPDNEAADPYVTMPKEVRLVDPVDAHAIVPNAVHPEDIITAEEKTKQRFEKYGPRIDMTETLSMLAGFFVGAATAPGIEFFKEKFIRGTGGTEAPRVVELGGYIDPTPLLDVLSSGVIT